MKIVKKVRKKISSHVKNAIGVVELTNAEIK
jgi:hypothetical protein